MYGYHQTHTAGLWGTPSAVPVAAPAAPPTPHQVDVTASKIARALYTHGPCSAMTISAVADDEHAPRKLAELAQGGFVNVREVAGVVLFVLRGNGVG